jgi:RNA recognition motif-containing protein
MSRLFLGNIPHAANEEEISYWMQSQGFTVAAVDIIKDHLTGNPRGFCFVTLTDGDQTDTAIATLHGRIMRGRPITVNRAVPLNLNDSHRERRRTA